MFPVNIRYVYYTIGSNLVPICLLSEITKPKDDSNRLVPSFN